MLPLIIKLGTGYTIDSNYPGEDRCPNCGGHVYHVVEDDYIVFCTPLACSWQDRTYYPKGISYYEMQKQILRKLFEDAFITGGCIHLKYNKRYPSCEHPVIIMRDACDYNYIIRDFDFSSGKSFFDSGYNVATQPIVRYSSLDDLIDDGWRLD